MIYYITGQIKERNPTFVIIEANGLAYQIFISLNTYSQLEGLSEARILTHFIVKEDGHFLYGFASEQERQLFIMLISVSGVGPNTARLILSSLDPESVRSAIQMKDDLVFRKIRGVGPKTAQRIIIDLYDKVGKEIPVHSGITGMAKSTKQAEAVSALIALGFNKSGIDQVFKSIPEVSNPEITVEELIKIALKKLAG